MNTLLNSKILKISIHENGAELKSVKNKNGLEFLWQAEKEIWPRHAPVLFPIVGKLKEDSYLFNDSSYSLSQHGFARDKQFKLIQLSDNSCTYELLSDEETKKVYPFDFVFQIKYELIENTLHTSYHIHNPAEELLYFSIGEHPGFNCPLLKEEKFEDYFLEFESSNYQLTELNNGLRKKTLSTLSLENKTLPLSSSLFDKDALVFENSQINKIHLISKKSGHKISMECKNWPYFGIWSKKGCTKFICLEPWYGIADHEGHNQELHLKDGILKLEPKKSFNCAFSITFQ